MASTPSLLNVQDAALHLCDKLLNGAEARWLRTRRLLGRAERTSYGGGDRKLALTPMGETYRREFQYMKRSTVTHMRRAGGAGVVGALSLAKHYAKLKKAVPDEGWMRRMCVDEEGEVAPEALQRQLFLVSLLSWEPGLMEWLSVEDKGLLREWVVWKEREEERR
jgi:hypothetical protein